MPSSDFQRALAVLRAGAPAGERALAAAFLAAEFVERAQPQPTHLQPADASGRMFGYGVAHRDAAPWDGRSMRSGTVTYADDCRVEQYVGQNTWIVYKTEIFDGALPPVGDQIRVAARNGAVAVERIGQNRLGASAARRAASGMVIARKMPLQPGEIETSVESVARRYGASYDRKQGLVDFDGGASLRVRLEDPAIHLDVSVQTDRPHEAYGAECALILCSALLTSDGSDAVDDTGIVFTGDRLYALAAGNQMRGDWFGFAAAAAKRAYPPAKTRVFTESSDELVIFLDKEQGAASVQNALGRSLELLAGGAARTGDPSVPQTMTVMETRDQAPGEWQPLFQFGYETVQVWIALGNGSVDWRPDVAALFGKPVSKALAFAIGTPVTEHSEIDVELCRSNAFLTVLAAGFMKGTGAIASDASGQLFSAADLLEIALYRRGTAF